MYHYMYNNAMSFILHFQKAALVIIEWMLSDIYVQAGKEPSDAIL